MEATATTPLVAISTFAMLIGLLLMSGSIRGAILLFKDAMKHKKFAKVIRIICAVVQLLSIIGSIIIVSIVLSNAASVTIRINVVMTILFGISLLAIVTNTRGGILLIIEATKRKGFAKWIRIACGVLMILALFSSFVTGI